jgi:tRNA (guanine26-N2/guanine27-N2)-dimethyltransferase
VTATDTAALCGSSPFSGLRKYASFALKTEYYPEVGVRVLIGRIFSESAKYDKAPQVLISFTKEHFYRVHIRFKRSPSSVKRAFKKFGYLFHCFKCSRRYISAITEETFSECDCGCRLTQMGPLWIGELHEAEFVKSLETPNEEIRKVVERIEGEADIPFYYDLHVTTRRLRISPPPIDSVIEGLEEAGFVATRTRFSGTSIKTNADIDELENILRNLKS